MTTLMGAVETSRGTGATPTDLVRRLERAGFVVGSGATTTTTVLDTFDGRLHHEGLRLDRAGPTLVLHEDGGAGGAVQLPAAGAPRFATDLAPGPFRSRLADVLEVRALLPVSAVTARSRRAEQRNGDDKVTSVVTIHENVAVDGAGVDGWFVTVEELTGYAKAGGRARDLVAREAGDPVPGDAVACGLAMAGVDLAGRRAEPGIALDPDLPAIEGFRLVLADLDDAVELNRQGTIDDVDAEFLHDLRVAVRRSRSILKHSRKVLAPDVLAWAEPGLKLVGTVTGPPRDLDVQVLEWDADVAELDDVARRALDPLHARLVRHRATAHEQLAATLRAGDVVELLRRWHDTVHAPMDPAAGGPHAEQRVLKVVRRRIAAAQHRILEHGRAVTPDSPADDVHDVRKDAKQLRYLLECFAGLFPDDERSSFVKRLKRLQALLGDHQDAAVQADELRRDAEELPKATPPATYLAVGQLVEHLERKRHAARERFADRFAEYDSAATRQALDDMLAGAGG